METPAAGESRSIDPKDISIVLPALNEEEGLERLLPRLKELYPDSEILVVDDGSTDRTVEVAERLGARAVSHPYRKGNGSAVRTGIRMAKRKYLVLMDADGQHRPEEIDSLVQPLTRYDLVVGARIEDKTSPWHRKLANSLYNRFATYLTTIPIQDLTSGFRAIRRKLALQFCYLLPNTYSYPSTLTLSLVRAGYSIKYVPIDIQKRIGRSKISLVRDGVRFLLIMIKVIMLFAPLRVFLPISLLCFLVGLGRGAYSLYFFRHFPPLAEILLIAALLTFLMGLIG
ncbi:MAG: glycosyltransferase family 2 protein, partial [Candidatus Omnitrophica bacterium]|nr:glycosyltransferase family 2 protein [Candidatus Omnitrophota bacterium]